MSVADSSPPSKPRGSGLIRSSMIYSSLTMVSRVMGFARDLAVTYAMGASAAMASAARISAFSSPSCASARE